MRTLIFNGKILDFNSEANYSENAVLIEDKLIKDIAPYKKLRYSTDINHTIDFKGKFLLPGLTDTHTHLYEVAKKNISVDLNGLNTAEEISSALLNFRNGKGCELGWIVGFGWDKNKVPASILNKTFLDKIIAEKPVFLSSKDLHTCWCNSMALREIGLSSSTPFPKGGWFSKDSAGNPDGVIYEGAVFWAYERVSFPDICLREKIVEDTIKGLYKLGLTAIHSMEDESVYELYKSLLHKKVTYRIWWHFPAAILDKMIIKKVTSYQEGEFPIIAGMKVFMDGSLGSKTAFMFDHYPDEPDNFGTMAISETELYNLVMKAAKNGISSSIHAIGDRCNFIVANILADVRKECGDKLLHRIEHLQAMRSSDYHLLKENKIFCSVQPIHMQNDIPVIDRLWSSAANHTYNFKSLFDNDILCAFGSDAPVETINPFLGIYSAIERKYQNHPGNLSWHPEEKISVWEAIKGYTINAAKISGSEKLFGSIEIGKKADLVVIEDFTKHDSEFWLEAEAEMTMIDGEIVYHK